jgi:hypothetical protein
MKGWKLRFEILPCVGERDCVQLMNVEGLEMGFSRKTHLSHLLSRFSLLLFSKLKWRNKEKRGFAQQDA